MKREKYAKQYAEFITVTCLNWLPVLQDDRIKDVIIDSLSHLTKTNRIRVFAFVIMSNHFHLIWQMLGDEDRSCVQRDFLKYTAQQILMMLRTMDPGMRSKLLVNANDRKYQVWKRNSLGIPLYTDNYIWQKLNYIHRNPVAAGLCEHDDEYMYSSAAFYKRSCTRWRFVTHC